MTRGKQYLKAVLDSNSQWVVAGSSTRLVWYFQVGEVPIIPSQKTEIQLFASTILDEKFLTINAPTVTGGDFTKAGLR